MCLRRSCVCLSTAASQYFVKLAGAASPAVHPGGKLLKSLSCCCSILGEIYHPVDIKWYSSTHTVGTFQRSFTQTRGERPGSDERGERWYWAKQMLTLLYVMCVLLCLVVFVLTETMCCDVERGAGVCIHHKCYKLYKMLHQCEVSSSRKLLVMMPRLKECDSVPLSKAPL